MKNLFLYSLLTLTLNCGDVREIRMDPMQFKARKEKGNIKVDIMDPEILFKEGSDSFGAMDYDEAFRKFNVIIEEFSNSKYSQAALFNAGLALKKLERYQDGLAVFDKYLLTYKEIDKYRREAISHSAECLEKLEKWEEMLSRLEEFEQNGELTLGEKISIYSRKGKALRMLKKYFEAEKELKKVTDLYKNEADNPIMKENYYIGMTFFEIGEIYRELFSSIKFSLPVERMEKDLIDKANLFMKSQNSYLRAIRIHNLEWAIIAGFSIGKLYEDFYGDFINAEVPPELTKEEVEVYFEELKKYITPLLMKAIEVYERNISLAERTGKGEKWLIEMENRLNNLRDFLKNEK